MIRHVGASRVTTPLPQRQLVAILYADVVGYSRLMGADEAGTYARLKALREAVFEPQLATYNGRVMRLMGDGTLVTFTSIVDSCLIII